MKSKILIFIIGVLVGAIITSCGFLIYTKIVNPNNSTPANVQKNGNMGEPPSKPDGDNNSQPPAKPGENSSDNLSNNLSNSNS